MNLPLPQAWKNSNDDTGDLTLYFEALSLLLPSTSKAATPFDRQPQPVISEMIQRSPIMARASEVLRHGAIEEINQRCRPIAMVLDFLEALAGHESTCPLLFHPRVLYPTTEQVPQIVLKTSRTGTRTQKSQNTAGGIKYETSESLAAVAEHLAIPARKFVEASRRVGSLDAEYEKGESLVALKRICSIADSLRDLRAQLTIGTPPEPSSPPSRRPNVTTRNARNAAKQAESQAVKDASKAASEWHRANCLKEVSDDIILKSFQFATAARQAGISKPAAGRMRKLLAQVSSLSTDLPDGIYVRHGESRMDVMKVLIIGPPDTPYEHGLFEFDLFCGTEFPQRPPDMFFRTTGGGMARFNPNLYTNGKSKLYPR
jgi:baculoviral IAP repeat-containing protein 6